MLAAEDMYFGFKRGVQKSTYSERFTYTAAAGEKMERVVSMDLSIHNDGYLIITHQSFGEKNKYNTLDFISMKKLFYSYGNVRKTAMNMMDSNKLCHGKFEKLYLIPDKGNLFFYWPNVFDDRDVGFVNAVLEDPRLKYLTWSEKLKRKVAKQAAIKANGGKKPKKGKKKKDYQGAHVIFPKKTGVFTDPISTFDFGSLYPSLLQLMGLCFTTFLTRKSVKRHGFEPWEYTEVPLGTEDAIKCGELSIDQNTARNRGYHTDRLKKAIFYGTTSDDTVMGSLIAQLKLQRKQANAKKALEEAIVDGLKEEKNAKRMTEDQLITGEVFEAFLNIRDINAENTVVNRYRETIADLEKNHGRGLAFSTMMAKASFDVYNNAQNSFKICLNATYGFCGVNFRTALLPCMEIAAAITATGRYELERARSISERTLIGTGLKSLRLLNRSNAYTETKKPADINLTDVSNHVKMFGNKHKVSKSNEGASYCRAPLVDASAFLQIKDSSVYKSRHRRISKYKTDVLYGDR